jgi:hypothetical protein
VRNMWECANGMISMRAVCTHNCQSFDVPYEQLLLKLKDDNWLKRLRLTELWFVKGGDLSRGLVAPALRTLACDQHKPHFYIFSPLGAAKVLECT